MKRPSEREILLAISEWETTVNDLFNKDPGGEAMGAAIAALAALRWVIGQDGKGGTPTFAQLTNRLSRVTQIQN